MKFSYLLALLALGVLAGAAYLFQGMMEEQRGVSAPPIEGPAIIEEEPTPSPDLGASPAPPAALSLEARIAEEVNAKTYGDLADAMTDPVTVILYATECCGPRPPAQAALDMQYLDDGAPYTFDQTQATIVDLKAKDPTNFGGTYVGLSQGSEKGVALTINAADKITKIFILASYKFFAP